MEMESANKGRGPHPEGDKYTPRAVLGARGGAAGRAVDAARGAPALGDVASRHRVLWWSAPRRGVGRGGTSRRLRVQAHGDGAHAHRHTHCGRWAQSWAPEARTGGGAVRRTRAVRVECTAGLAQLRGAARAPSRLASHGAAKGDVRPMCVARKCAWPLKCTMLALRRVRTGGRCGLLGAAPRSRGAPAAIEGTTWRH